MKKIIIPALILTVGLLASCGNPSGNQHSPAAGGRIYGGTLSVNENDNYVSLYPHNITDVISHDIANQIYDGLVRFDNKNITKVLPDIAENWETDATGSVYTFKLRKGVMFHDDPCFPQGKGREVTAKDFKYSFELLCTAGENNNLFESSFKGKVKGADKFYENSKNGKHSELDGVKALDDYTLQITLLSPASTFLYLLAGPVGYVFPKEAVEKYDAKTSVGTGPFMVKNISDEKIILAKNSSYFRTDSLGNKLPFLDSVVFNFISDKTKEMEAFKKGETHIIFGLPAMSISEMVEQSIADFSSKNPKYILLRNPEMTTEYYQFNIIKPPFNNLKLRQAFSYAINRDKIIEEVLNTEAFGAGICGITPPGIAGYDITSVRGYNFNPDKAKKLLAEAGYPNGKNFPRATIELNSGGGKHVNVVEEIKRQLKEVLNVDVDFVVVPFSQKIEDDKYARTEIFRSAWIADYPSAENFLGMFYGATVPDSLSKPSFPNTSRYRNPACDALLEKGFSAKDIDEGNKYYQQAEQLVMDDAPVIVLWYGENLKVIHSFVKNFYFNPMNYKDFSEVYIQKSSSPSAKP